METAHTSHVGAVLALLLLPGLTMGQVEPSNPTAEFRLIVHTANPVAQMPRDHVRRIFLRTERRWADGESIRPVDQSMTTPTREAFSERVLGMSILAVRHHWSQQLFSGGEPPPPTRDSEQAILEFVGQNRGAIGYVSLKAALLPDVKQVEVTR